jgi:hypothetical protein
MSFIKKSFDTSKYNFYELISREFDVDDLSEIYKERNDLLPNEYLTFNTESKTKFHNIFYKKLDEGWSEIVDSYEFFIENEISKLFKDDFVYQTFPTFRIHLPNEQAIHYWHHDSDADHMHPEWEINFQLAITDMYETNCTWIESIPGLRDFFPMELKYGEYSIFDGNRCLHGNKINVTGKTRISLDFRIMPIDKYREFIKKKENKRSATTNKEFKVGKYYKLFIKKEKNEL